MADSMKPEVEVVADAGSLCGEGPFWDEREQALYWTDITGCKLFRYLWQERRHELLSDNFEVSGFCRQQDGGYVVTNSRGIWLWSPGKAAHLLAKEVDGQECVMNDCSADPVGRVYGGSCHLDAEGRSAPSFLFRVDTDGSVTIADEGICFSNGVAISDRNNTLYFADTVARCIYAYDWRRSDGALSNRRVFARVDRSEGVPDGLAIDAEGFVWCAQWFGGCVTRFDPDGKPERCIAIPAAQSSSVCFGGPDLDEIYVTSAAKSNAEVLAPEGYDPARVFLGGPLYRVKLGIRGQLKYRSNISRPVSRAPSVSGATSAKEL